MEQSCRGASVVPSLPRFSVLFLDPVRSIVVASAYYPNLLSAGGKKIALSAIPYSPIPRDSNIGSVPHMGNWTWQFVIRSLLSCEIGLRP